MRYGPQDSPGDKGKSQQVVLASVLIGVSSIAGIGYVKNKSSSDTKKPEVVATPKKPDANHDPHGKDKTGQSHSGHKPKSTVLQQAKEQQKPPVAGKPPKADKPAAAGKSDSKPSAPAIQVKPGDSVLAQAKREKAEAEAKKHAGGAAHNEGTKPHDK